MIFDEYALSRNSIPSARSTCHRLLIITTGYERYWKFGIISFEFFAISEMFSFVNTCAGGYRCGHMHNHRFNLHSGIFLATSASSMLPTTHSHSMNQIIGFLDSYETIPITQISRISTVFHTISSSHCARFTTVKKPSIYFLPFDEIVNRTFETINKSPVCSYWMVKNHWNCMKFDTLFEK